MPFATISELKSYLNIVKATEDVLLQSILDASVATAERYTGRLLTPVPALDADPPVTKTFTLVGRRAHLPDARAITAVTVDGVAVPAVTATVDGYRLAGSPAYRLTVPLTHDAGFVLQVTGRFGLSPAPADLKDAVLALAARRYRERDAAYGDTVTHDDGLQTSYFRQLPAAVKLVLESYKLPLALA